MLRLPLAAVVIVVLLAAPVASAGVYGEVLSPSGAVIASGQGASFDYPADGSLVHVGSATTADGSVTLDDVSVVGNLVQATQLYVPSSRGQQVQGQIVAGGQVVASAPNTLVQLGPDAYVVVDQRARATGGQVGHVALRVVLTHDAFGVQAGTQIVLGASGAAPVATKGSGGKVTLLRNDPLAALGFSGGQAAVVGFTPAPSITSGPVGERAVAIAEQYLGVPYAWGGASPITGFDCSGLAMYVYAQLGITLTHYTGAQFTEGIPVPRADLEPGDLVFFEPDAEDVPQHEGIYIGDGQFIQAPHTGDVVKISSLDDPRYGLDLVGAVRPFSSGPD